MCGSYMELKQQGIISFFLRNLKDCKTVFGYDVINFLQSGLC